VTAGSRPRPASYRLAWAAPFLVGAAAAIAAEVATGILLYAGPGLMRSLTTVLAVQGVAFAAGLRGASAITGPRSLERLRRRWVFCLFAFVAAALFGTSWSVVADLGGGAVGQGLGLAVLGALPLYACGSVLAGMSAVAAEDPLGVLRGPGPAAALGAAAGFVLTGALLPRAPIPASLLVACLVLLSAGGMIYGIVLASRPMIVVRATRRSVGTEVRVEDRMRLTNGDAARYLLEAGHPRRYVSLEDNGATPWDVVVARSLLADKVGPAKVLCLGGGASSLPGTLASERPETSVDVLERNPAVLDLARDHFEGEAGNERVRVRVGNLDDLLAEAQGPYDLVLVDTGALAPIGGVAGLSRRARHALLGAVAWRGALAVGPYGNGRDLAAPADAWRTTEMRRPAGAGSEEEVVRISRRDGAGAWTAAVGDFRATGEEASGA